MAGINEMINLAKYQSGQGRLTGMGGGGGIVDLLSAMMQRKTIQDEKKIKRQQDRADFYKTLRSAGYDPKKAYDAVMKNDFPTAPGGISSDEIKAKKQVDKLSAETEKIKAQTLNIGQSSSNLRQKIIQKVADGLTLTPGEQKIYDEVIKKYGKKSDLETILANKAAGIDTQAAPAQSGNLVPMTDPSGKNKLVPQENVEKAKAKGWKLR